MDNIKSTFGIKFDVSKVVKELGTLEKRLETVSQASETAERAALELKQQQTSVANESKRNTEEIKKQIQALKTQAQISKENAQRFKSIADVSKANAQTEVAAARVLQQQNIATARDTRRSANEQKNAVREASLAYKNRAVAYKEDALAFKRAQADIRQQAQRTTRGVETAAKGFGLLRNAIAAIGVGVAARSFIDLSDRATQLNNRLKVATSSTEELNASFAELRRISRDTGTSLESNTLLFQRLSSASENLGATNTDILKLTDTIANLNRISGASSEDIKNSTRQIAQAFGQTNLRAEEFNSILDQSPELINVAAEAMGKTVAQFSLAVREGEILSKDVYDALLSKSDDVARRAALLPLTFSQASQSLGNELIVAVGDLNNQLGITRNLAGGMKALADNADLLTNILKGTIVTVGSLTAAWAAYTVAVKLADLRTKQLAFTLGPIGAIAAGVAVVAGLALSYSLFADELNTAEKEAEDLALRLREATTQAQALATVEQASDGLKEANKEYERLVALREKLQKQPQVTFGTNSTIPSAAARQLVEVNQEIEVATANIERFNDLVANGGAKAQQLGNEQGQQDRTQQLKEEADTQRKNFEDVVRSLETERESAERVFKRKRELIELNTAAESRARLDLTARARAEYDEKLSLIQQEENAEQQARRTQYEAIIAGFQTERDLLLEHKLKEQAIIEEFAVGDEREQQLEKLQAFYDQELAIIEENEAAKADKIIQEERRKLGVFGSFLNQEQTLRENAGKNKVQYAAQIGNALLQGANQNNRKIFEATKAFQLAEATILGFKAIQQAYASAPAPLSFGLAALMAAKVAIQINGIKNQKFGGSATPSASGGGGVASGQSTVASAQAQQAVPQLNQNISISVEGIDDEGVYSGTTIRRISEEISKQFENGVTNVRFA